MIAFVPRLCYVRVNIGDPDRKKKAWIKTEHVNIALLQWLTARQSDSGGS